MTGAHEERGSALIMVLLLVVTVAGLAAAVADGSRRLATDNVDARAAARALHAADAGVEAARVALRADASYRGETLTVGGVEVEVRVRRSGDGAWTVESAARVAEGARYARRAVVAELRARDGALPAVARFASSR